MMKSATTRRGILAGLAAVVAAPAIVPAASLMSDTGSGNPFRFHGDGIGDDHPWLQWEADNAARLGRPFVLKGKTCRISRALRLHAETFIEDCVFRAGRGEHGLVIDGGPFDLSNVSVEREAAPDAYCCQVVVG